MNKKIDIYLDEKSSYINPFHKNRISSELSDYILGECKIYSLKEQFEICIHCKENLSKEEQLALVAMIRQNYGVDIQEINLFARRRNGLGLSCILLGILILFIYLLVDIVPVLSEIVLIVAWVFLWEGVYGLLFDGSKDTIHKKRLKKLTCCKISFSSK